MNFFGPVFFLDMCRMARKRWCFVARSLYATVIFTSLVLACLFVTNGASQMDPGALAVFAEDFAFVFLVGQFVGVVALTGPYVGGAIAGERRKQTWEALLTTALADHEIVLGKFASRLAHIALVLLTGLPILGLLQLLGGIRPGWIWVGFLLTGLTMLANASIYLLHSVTARQAISTQFATFHIASFVADILVAGGAGICLWLAHSSTFYIAIGLYALLELAATAFCLTLAVRRVRSTRSQRTAASGDRAVRRKQRPPVSDMPILWKDWSDGVRPAGVIPALVLMSMALGCAAIFAMHLQFGHPLTEVNLWISVVGLTGAAMLLLLVGFLAATSLAVERDQRTLDSLLATPLTTGEILAAKWWNSLGQPCVGYALLGATWVMATLCGGPSVKALPVLTVALAVYAAFMSSLGLLIATYTATKVQAQVWTLAGGLFFASGGPGWPFIVAALLAGNDYIWLAFLGAGLTPLGVLVLAALQWDTHGVPPNFAPLACCCVVGVTLYAAGTQWLWRLALARFNRTCGRTDNFSPPRTAPDKLRLDTLHGE
jgi:ABC-type Na+ efflux pump permease subunit